MYTDRDTCGSLVRQRLLAEKKLNIKDMTISVEVFQKMQNIAKGLGYEVEILKIAGERYAIIGGIATVSERHVFIRVHLGKNTNTLALMQAVNA